MICVLKHEILIKNKEYLSSFVIIIMKKYKQDYLLLLSSWESINEIILSII